MGKKLAKGALPAVVMGAVLQFGGCTSVSWWTQALWTAAGYAGLELVLDNDSVFDLFEDGFVDGV